MIDILDARGRVVCAGTLVSSDWVITAGACLEAAAEVQWGPQRILVRERVAEPRGGTGAAALLRLEHSMCLNSALRMDDGSNIGAGQLALPSTYQWQTRWASEDNVHRASVDTTASKHVLGLSMLRSPGTAGRVVPRAARGDGRDFFQEGLRLECLPLERNHAVLPQTTTPRDLRASALPGTH